MTKMKKRQKQERKSLKFSRYHAALKGWGWDFALNDPLTLDDNFERLIDWYAPPSAQPGTSAVEFLLEVMEEEATKFLKAEGYINDLAPYDLQIWHNNIMPPYPVASAMGVITDAHRLRYAMDDQDPEQIALTAMLLMANLIRASTFNTLMLGLAEEEKVGKAGRAGGRARSHAARERHMRIVLDAKTLLRNGRHLRELSGILAQRHGCTSQWIRQILRRYGIHPEKKAKST